MMNLVLYIHGKGGSSAESEHYKKIFTDCDVIGLEYKNSSEIHNAVKNFKSHYDKIILIANSIGAFFAMNADIEKYLQKAYFISPIVDMEKIIKNLMEINKISEEDLQREGTIQIPFGEKLSWEYLKYVRENPLKWNVPTKILYGEKDNLTTLETIKNFADKHNAEVTIMENGEHWFHTEEQIKFLNAWIKNGRD